MTSIADRSDIRDAAVSYSAALHRRRLTNFAMAVVAVIAGSAAAIVPARATLAVGAPAPDFTLPSAIAGKASQFSLRDALTNGPDHVYIYPKSFTSV